MSCINAFGSSAISFPQPDTRFTADSALFPASPSDSELMLSNMPFMSIFMASASLFIYNPLFLTFLLKML